MDVHTLIFVTDARQQYICEFLSGKVIPYKWEDEACEERVISQMRLADQIILPTPVSKMDQWKDATEILKHNLWNCKRAFGGKFGPEWKVFFKEKNIDCIDLMENETVTRQNAYITAEGTVAEILKHSKYSIRGQKIVISGYGRCAKALAKLLTQMGAKITILARKAQARKDAKAQGYDAVDFSYGPDEVYGAYTLVNTVPALVITKRIIQEMHRDAVIIDIASKPGGCDKDAAQYYQIPVVEALSLPGIYTTKSSAKIMADEINRELQKNGSQGEGHTWISQIIL